jgi:hypothetical protein
MEELTNLESKLGEVLGLAQAAQKATRKIGSLVEDEGVKSTLEQMHEEAAERRATEIASSLDGKKTAIEEKGRETRSEAEEMMNTYLDDDANGLDGLEFLTVAEAGELGHMAIVRKMNEEAGNAEVQEFVEWVLPIQERHFERTKEAALVLAAREDPNSTRVTEGAAARRTLLSSRPASA